VCAGYNYADVIKIYFTKLLMSMQSKDRFSIHPKHLRAFDLIMAPVDVIVLIYWRERKRAGGFGFVAELVGLYFFII